MKIKEICPTDQQIVSPSFLVSDICSFTDQPFKLPKRNSLINQNSTNEILNLQQSHSLIRSQRRTNKRDQQGLKRLIRQQKVKILVNRFIQKLKLNNINSKPVIYQPYQVQQRQSIHSRAGIQLPDIYEKILSILIAIYIMICLFIDTTASLFPQIIDNPVIKVGQLSALAIFLIEFISSCIVVKTVEGKKIDKITQIITNYLSDGFIIDFAYLIVLITSFFYQVGNLRLVILLKLPQCLERIQRIQNTYVNTFYKQQYWGLAKVFLLNFIFSHFLSLLLIMMAQIDPQNSWLSKMQYQNTAWYEQYIWGFYWGTTIMLTVGFGDITPANYNQAICVVIIETFSCLALAYNINCVGNLISNIKSQDIQKNKNIKTFKMLSSRNNISQDLQLKIHNYIEQSTNIKKKFNFEDQSKFISTLPTELKADFLKESNKRIFQNLVFFKNLTQKTLLALAEVIETKICHPQEVIKKRGQLSGITILKQGKIAYCTKIGGSNWSNVSIDKVIVKQNEQPYLLSLDFISLQRSTYEVKSEEYSILYFLSFQKTLEVLKTGELDYEHFCFLRDRCRSLTTEYQVFKCQFCKSCHTKFDCPRIHYCPLKKHIVDKYLHNVKVSKNRRNRQMQRVKRQLSYPFRQLENNLKMVELYQDIHGKYTTWRRRKSNVIKNAQDLAYFGMQLNQSNKLASHKNIYSFTPNNMLTLQIDQKTNKQSQDVMNKIEHQILKDIFKDQISTALLNNHSVWLIQCDQIKNYKFYFSSYNAIKKRIVPNLSSIDFQTYKKGVNLKIQKEKVFKYPSFLKFKY